MEDAEDNEWTETRLTGCELMSLAAVILCADVRSVRSDGRLASASNDVEDIDEDETPAGRYFIL